MLEHLQWLIVDLIYEVSHFSREFFWPKWLDKNLGFFSYCPIFNFSKVIKKLSYIASSFTN